MPEAKVEYEQMQLHDGEDDAKTETLHHMLNPLMLAGHDWEGSDSGISIQLLINVGDTIQISKDGWIRVVRATKMGSVEFTEKDM